MPFKTDLRLESVRGTKNRILTDVLIYKSELFDKIIRIPIGTVSDLASVPNYIKWLVDDDASYIRDAAIVHDFLYSNNSNLSYPRVNRFEADSILWEGMGDLGATSFKRSIVFNAVRCFGWMFYKKD